MSTLDGAVRAQISNEVVRLHSEYYGRGPTKAKVYVKATSSRSCWRRASRPPRRRS